MRPNNLAIPTQSMDVRPSVRQEDPHSCTACTEAASATKLLNVVDIFSGNGLMDGDGLWSLAVCVVKIQIGLATHTIAESLAEGYGTAIGRLKIRIEVFGRRRPSHHKPELTLAQRRRQDESLGIGRAGDGNGLLVDSKTSVFNLELVRTICQSNVVQATRRGSECFDNHTTLYHRNLGILDGLAIDSIDDLTGHDTRDHLAPGGLACTNLKPLAELSSRLEDTEYEH